MALLSYDIVEEILEVADKYSAKQQELLDRRADAVQGKPEAVPGEPPMQPDAE